MKCRAGFAGVLFVVVAGCSDGPDIEVPLRTQSVSAVSTTASAAEVAWMEEFCGVIRDLQRAIWTSPPESTPDERNLKPSISATLGTTSESLTNAVQRLGGLAASPVDGGDRVARELGSRYADLQQEVADAKEKVDALPDGVSANEVGAVMGTVWPQVAELNAKPFKDTELTPAMRAAGRSPTCTSIAGWPR